jgi:FkbM family methyltransferase
MRKLYRKIKLLFRILSGKEVVFKKQVDKPMKWYGVEGAGFFVFEDNLSNNSIVYSFGVGEDISFDTELIKRFDCKIYAFDPTPKSIKYIDSQPKSDNFIFNPYGLYNEDGFIKFYLPENPDYVSGTSYNRWNYNEKIIKPIEVPVKKFSSITKQLGHKKIDILKIDIEGSEYDVIDDILNSDVIIDQILVEVHHRFPGVSIKKTIDLVDKLNAAGYKIAKVSESHEEYSFLK